MKQFGTDHEPTAVGRRGRSLLSECAPTTGRDQGSNSLGACTPARCEFTSVQPPIQQECRWEEYRGFQIRSMIRSKEANR